VKVTSVSSSRASSVAALRTLTSSGPAMLTIDAGVDACVRAARAMALASPCHIVLKYPIVTSTGSRRDTRRARSTGTPYRISVA
jgi:hypothetical protein